MKQQGQKAARAKDRLERSRREQFLCDLAEIKASQAKQWMTFESYKTAVLGLAKEYWNELTETERQLLKGFESEEPRTL